MFTLIQLVLFSLALVLLLVPPWPVALGGLIGALIGMLAGNTIGIASDGTAVAGTKFVALVGYVVGALVTYVWILQRQLRRMREGEQTDGEWAPSGGVFLLAVYFAIHDTVVSWFDKRHQKHSSTRNPQSTAVGYRSPASTHVEGRSDAADEASVEPAPVIDHSSTPAPPSKMMGMAIAAIAIAGVIMYFVTTPGESPEESSSESATIRDRDQPDQRFSQDIYNRLTQHLGYTLPQIDPRSSEYEHYWVERLRDKRDEYVQNGYGEWEALVAAAEELSAPSGTERQSSTQSNTAEGTGQEQTSEPQSSARNSKSANDPSRNDQECVLKNVMSDADYRACGITPPRGNN